MSISPVRKPVEVRPRGILKTVQGLHAVYSVSRSLASGQLAAAFRLATFAKNRGTSTEIADLHTIEDSAQRNPLRIVPKSTPEWRTQLLSNTCLKYNCREVRPLGT